MRRIDSDFYLIAAANFELTSSVGLFQIWASLKQHLFIIYREDVDSIKKEKKNRPGSFLQNRQIMYAESKSCEILLGGVE